MWMALPVHLTQEKLFMCRRITLVLTAQLLTFRQILRPQIQKIEFRRLMCLMPAQVN